MKRIKYELLVFIVCIIIRLPNLGFDTFNTDIWKWKTRSYNFSNGVFNLDLGQTLQRYHPGVMLMWHGTAGIKLYNLYYDLTIGGEPASNEASTIFGLNFFQKLMVSVSLAFCLALLFYMLRQLFGLKYAAISIALLLFEPFYNALSREFHLEGLMSTYMLVSLIATFGYYKTKSTRYLILSSLFAVFAVLTKISALVLLPFTCLMVIAPFYATGKSLKDYVRQSVRPVGVWLGVFVIASVVLWPALFVRPLDVYYKLLEGIFSVGIEEGHEQLFFGKYVTDPGILFYPVVLLFKSSIFMLPGVLGYFIWARKHANSELKTFNKFLLIFSILYILPLLASSKKLDRYILPNFLTLSLISASFYYYLYSLKTKVFYSVVVPISFVWVMFIAYIHPDYLSYYSPLTGGLRVGINVIEPKWMYGGLEVRDYFQELKEKNNYTSFTQEDSFKEIMTQSDLLADKLVVAFPEKYYNQMYPFLDQIGGRAVIDKLTGESKYAKYFVFPVWEDRHQYLDKHKVIYFDSIYVRGVKSFIIYRRLSD